MLELNNELMINLLIISIIIALGYNSGFFDNVDEWINKKWKFFHLPYVIKCPFCATHWFCLLYIIIIGEFTFFNWLYILLLCNLGELIPPILATIKNGLLKIIELINRLIG